jgi:hypothetical protein
MLSFSALGLSKRNSILRITEAMNSATPPLRKVAYRWKNSGQTLVTSRTSPSPGPVLASPATSGCQDATFPQEWAASEQTARPESSRLALVFEAW